MKKEDWVWMPHGGHFICCNNCRFRLATYVGKYLVSTVGEYVPDEPVREICAKVRGISLEGRGDDRLADWLKKNDFEKLGADRKYETMVFEAGPDPKNECCPYSATSYSELDFGGYNDAASAYKGHLALCEKWAGK